MRDREPRQMRETKAARMVRRLAHLEPFLIRLNSSANKQRQHRIHIIDSVEKLTKMR
jgi:hypothetical protein